MHSYYRWSDQQYQDWLMDMQHGTGIRNTPLSDFHVPTSENPHDNTWYIDNIMSDDDMCSSSGSEHMEDYPEEDCDAISGTYKDGDPLQCDDDSGIEDHLMPDEQQRCWQRYTANGNYGD